MIGALAALALLAGGAYGVLLIVTPDAPLPPSFGRAEVPRFAPSIDGRWYNGRCRALRIVGGWILPQTKAALPRIDGTELTLDEPVDLTSLRPDGRPLTFDVGAARLSIRWQNGSLRIQGGAKGAPVHVRLVRQQPSGC